METNPFDFTFKIVYFNYVVIECLKRAETMILKSERIQFLSSFGVFRTNG